MIPKPIWTGGIAFGPVVVPVRMSKAVGDEGGIAFRQLCPCHNKPIKQLKTCPESGDPIVGDPHKGLEVGKDRFELFDEIELQDLRVESLHTIALEDFVHPEEVPSELYVKEAYYLEPTEVGVGAYALLREALRRTGAVGLGKIAIRQRERLVTVRATDRSALLLNTLAWPQEIRPEPEIPVVEINPKHLDAATLLVETMASDFTPEKFRDTFATAVRARVEDRIAGTMQPVPATPAKDTSTMFAELEAAVKAARPKKKAPGATDTPSRRPAGQPGRATTGRRSKARKRRAA